MIRLLRYLLQKRDAISKKLLQVQARNAEMQQQISLTTKRIIDLQKKNKELMGKVRDAEAELKGVTKQQEYERATTLYASR
jgi:septal ring factor EnvC (AmiA/AmiB activator)